MSLNRITEENISKYIGKQIMLCNGLPDGKFITIGAIGILKSVNYPEELAEKNLYSATFDLIDYVEIIKGNEDVSKNKCKFYNHYLASKEFTYVFEVNNYYHKLYDECVYENKLNYFNDKGYYIKIGIKQVGGRTFVSRIKGTDEDNKPKYVITCEGIEDDYPTFSFQTDFCLIKVDSKVRHACSMLTSNLIRNKKFQDINDAIKAINRWIKQNDLKVIADVKTNTKRYCKQKMKVINAGESLRCLNCPINCIYSSMPTLNYTEK